MFYRTRIRMLVMLVALVVPFGTVVADPGPRTVVVKAGDDMKFSLAEIRAKRGEPLRIVLTSRGTMPKAAMAHNLVVLARGTDPTAFVNASAMSRDTNFVASSFKARVLAATPLAGNGETVDVTFTVPEAPGRYDFVCSFPGHFLAGMRGVLIVS